LQAVSVSAPFDPAMAGRPYTYRRLLAELPAM